MGGKEIRDPDLLNSFTLYKALDRLLTLAKTAADMGISEPARVKLDALFQQGLGEVQSFLASATGAKLNFAFARSTTRSEEHKSELQSLMRISYAVFCLTQKNKKHKQ